MERTFFEKNFNLVFQVYKYEQAIEKQHSQITVDKVISEETFKAIIPKAKK